MAGGGGGADNGCSGNGGGGGMGAFPGGTDASCVTYDAPIAAQAGTSGGT